MIFEKLREIKQYRLTRKQQLLKQIVEKMNILKLKIDEAKESLNVYVNWRLSEEDRLYDEATQSLLSRQGIDELRNEISQLRSKDTVLNQHILDYENQLDVAIKEKEVCAREIVGLQKANEKYKVLCEREAILIAKEQEFIEEDALDEFSMTCYSGAGL